MSLHIPRRLTATWDRISIDEQLSANSPATTLPWSNDARTGSNFRYFCASACVPVLQCSRPLIICSLTPSSYRLVTDSNVVIMTAKNERGYRASFFSFSLLFFSSFSSSSFSFYCDLHTSSSRRYRDRGVLNTARVIVQRPVQDPFCETPRCPVITLWWSNSHDCTLPKHFEYTINRKWKFEMMINRNL